MTMSRRNKQWMLASRPRGSAEESNFTMTETEVPALHDGQILVKVHYLSLDPYMRGRMDESRSYAAPQPLNAVMIGGTVGVVEASKNPSFAVGDNVVGMFGWQEVGVSDGRGIQKVDTRHIPLSAYLGSVGMPGVTAWYGLNKIMLPKPGQTVAVSAASGAVGSVVGQLAKLKGCRAVGFAGGKDKCDYVVNELGFDACIDYKAAKDSKELYQMLKAATPDGIDSYFENVGGSILDAVLSRMNAFGRIAMCGMIAGYDGQPLPLQNPQLILVSRLTIEGFIVSEHMDVWPEALRELGGFVAQGKLKFRESVADGLASAPEAFIGLLKGKNFGKQLVKLV